MKKILIVTAILVLIAGIGFGIRLIFFGETPEAQIKRTFSELSHTVRKSGDEGMVVMLEKARAGARFFDDFCTLKLDRIPNGVGTMSRQNIAANTMMLRKYFNRMGVKFYDMEIHVDPDKPEAFVTFTAVFEGSPTSGRSVKETKEMDAGLVRKDGKWLFRSLAFRDVIRK